MATKKRRYDEGGKATASSPPPAPAKKKKSKLMLGGLGGLIPMAIQKEGAAGLSPAAMVKKYGVEVLSPMAMAMRRSRRLGPPPATTQAATPPPPPPPPPQRIIYPTDEEDRAPPSPAEEASGGMRRGGKAKSKPKGYAKGGKTKTYDPYGDYATSLAASTVSAARAERARKRKGEGNPDVLDPAEYIALSEKLRREGSPGYRPETVKKAADAIKRQGVSTGDEVYQRLKKAYATRGYAKGGKVSSRGDGIARKGKTKGRYI